MRWDVPTRSAHENLRFRERVWSGEPAPVPGPARAARDRRGGTSVLSSRPIVTSRLRPNARASPRIALGLLVLGLGWGPHTPRPVAAQDQPTPEATDRLVWTTGALHRILAERDYGAALVVASLARTLREPAGEGLSAEVDVLLSALSPRPGTPDPLRRCRESEDPLDGILCSLEALAPVAPPALARGMAEEGARLLGLYLRPGEAGSLPPMGGSGERRAWSPGPFQRFAEEALETTWRLRSGPPPDGAGVDRADLDAVLARVVGFSPEEPRERILARASGLREILALHPSLSAFVSSGGPPRADVLLEEYHTFLGSVVGSLRATLAELPGGQGAQARPGPPEGGAPAGGQGGWAAHRAFVYLAAGSAALAGLEPQVAERVRVFGNAASDLHRSGETFVRQLASAGPQAAMAALSGNLFAVAAGITSFFDLTPGGMGPGAARELRTLREAVAEVREEVEVRFDQVDARLADLFLVVDSRFGQLERLVESRDRAVQAQLRSVHQEVVALGRRMERMETTLHSYMQAGFDRDYNRTLIRCLEHRERHLPPHDRMEFPLFAECLTEFRARAVQDARDALLADHTTPVDDVSVAEALADPSLANLARRFPLLGRVASRRFAFPGLRGGLDLANPLEWAMASQAYLAMLQQWPEHARGVAPGDLEAIRDVGLELRTALRSIAREGAGDSRSPLLPRVLEYYDARVAELTSEADLLARRHEQAHLRRIRPEELMPRLEPLDQGRPGLDPPTWLVEGVPQEVRTAAVLGLAEARLGYRLVVRDSVAHENFRRAGLFRRLRHDRLTFTRTAVEVTLAFGAEAPVATYRASGPFVLARTEEMAGGEGSERVRTSRELVRDPAGRFLREGWPEVAPDPGRWTVSPPPLRALLELEERIEDELRRHESRTLNGVFTAVCDGGAARTALDGPDQESALRIAEALEGMSAARFLFRAYVRLGIPAAGEDVALREALDGPGGILDRAGLCAAISAGESPLRVVWLEEEPSHRAQALARALHTVLEEAEEVHGSLSLVEETLEQVEALLRIQRVRSMVARSEGAPAPVGPAGNAPRPR